MYKLDANIMILFNKLIDMKSETRHKMMLKAFMDYIDEFSENEFLAIPKEKFVDDFLLDYKMQRGQSEHEIKFDKQAFEVFLKEASDYLNTDIELVKAGNRKHEGVYVRQLSAHYLRKNKKISFKTIGCLFGGKNRATIYTAVKTIDGYYETNAKTREHVKQIYSLGQKYLVDTKHLNSM